MWMLLRRVLGCDTLVYGLRLVAGRLVSGFGGGEHYTAGQVMRAASDVRLPTQHLPAALAAYCSSAEYAEAVPDPGRRPYDEVRAELADQLGVDGEHWGARRVRGRQPRQSWNTLGWDQNRTRMGS